MPGCGTRPPRRRRTLFQFPWLARRCGAGQWCGPGPWPLAWPHAPGGVGPPSSRPANPSAQTAPALSVARSPHHLPATHRRPPRAPPTPSRPTRHRNRPSTQVRSHWGCGRQRMARRTPPAAAAGVPMGLRARGRTGPPQACPGASPLPLAAMRGDGGEKHTLAGAGAGGELRPGASPASRGRVGPPRTHVAPLVHVPAPRRRRTRDALTWGPASRLSRCLDGGSGIAGPHPPAPSTAAAAVLSWRAAPRCSELALWPHPTPPRATAPARPPTPSLPQP